MLNIVDQPRTFNLWGLAADVPNAQYGVVGMQLMDELWRQIRSASIRSEGTNHWVYLDGKKMFVGVQLLEGEAAPAKFENLPFELRRYVEHLHVGPYQLLPSVWHKLKAELASTGEVMHGPSLEVYGHQSPDPNAIPETTILIGLQPR